MTNNNHIHLDEIDYKILYLLQRDASISVADIASRVGLSPTPCWKRIKRMEEEKIILGSVTLVDPRKINCALSTYVMVRTNNHSEEWDREFTKVAKSFPEIIEICRITGENDYMMKVMVPTVESYDSVYRRLVKSINANLFDVTSIFTLEVIKQTTILPVPLADKEFIEKCNNELKSIANDLYEHKDNEKPMVEATPNLA